MVSELGLNSSSGTTKGQIAAQTQPDPAVLNFTSNLKETEDYNN